MLSLGIPFTLEKEHASVVILCGDLPYIFSNDELLEMLSGPVIADTGALFALKTLGLSELAGAVPADGHHNSYEILSDHPLNSGYAGYRRVILFEKCFELNPTSSGTQDLAFIEDPYGEMYPLPGITLFNNKLGGSVLAFGASHWIQPGYRHKMETLKRYLDHITCNTCNVMPVVIEDFKRVAPFIRTDGEKAAVILLNNMLDPTGTFSVKIRGKAQSAYTILPGGEHKTLDFQKTADGLRVYVDNLEAWETKVIFAI